MADGAAAELQHNVVAEQVEQLMHLSCVDAARGHRHDLPDVAPILAEEDAARQVDFVNRFAEDVVIAIARRRAAHRVPLVRWRVPDACKLFDQTGSVYSP